MAGKCIPGRRRFAGKKINEIRGARERLKALRKKYYPDIAGHLAVLGSSKKSVIDRYQSAAALGHLRDKHAVPALLKALKEDEASIVRWTAAQSLGYIGDRSALPGLLEALEKDLHPTVRRQVIYALGRFGGEKVAAVLRKILKEDADPDITAAASYSLRLLGGKKS